MKARVITYAKKVNLPIKLLYDAVADVANYPKILNYVKCAEIYNVHKNSMTVKMLVGRGPISFSYDCNVNMYSQSTIYIFSDNGPFILLKVKWEFIKIDNYTTMVRHKLEYKLHNQWMEKAAAIALKKNKSYTIDAFEVYARKLFN
ncbi:coenzyme Q-binding protein COQ10 [Candidatus Xenohaliotis californiensis]|uniref:Coenzyme Q-binding protein COQ10 n=1 Tax=Candidatus Xenohaliotis californiensis TaxID=84677 RepID=A0ABM9N7X4_9RICK|nr:coenzyme Q-binding protein COQ10 [Candidatus Xenohaliotis californiensis]